MPLATLVAVLLALAPPPPPSELETLKKACDKGGAAECRELGGRYERGEGVTADPGKAAGLLKKACELKLAPACLELAAASVPATA